MRCTKVFVQMIDRALRRAHSQADSYMPRPGTLADAALKPQLMCSFHRGKGVARC